MSPTNPVTESFESDLRSVLPPATFRPLTEAYLTEPRGKWRGQGGLVLAPADAGEVSTILTHASRARVGVVPVSGGTGLVSGQIAPELPRPIILSTERMAAIRGIWPEENVLVAEAGVILQDVRAAAAGSGRLFPLMLASEGSARIGGNLATNAGGMNVLRYGNARDLCLGIEAVLSDGTIVHGLKRLRKDNTGYDLRNLLIGSEGTLGVITAASLRLFAEPAAVSTVLMRVRDPVAALTLLDMTRARAGETLSIFELIDGAGFRFIEETMPDQKLPVHPVPRWMVLGELGVPVGMDGDAVWESVFVEGMAQGLVVDAILARSEAQRATLIGAREAIPEANRRIGAIASHDISLPLSALPEFIARADAEIGRLGALRINCFGHLGDGNLHYNIYPPKGRKRSDFPGLADVVTGIVHRLAEELDGSFSAEHGIGRAKVVELERFGDPGRLAAMRSVKDALDPNGIMNPGAVLRELP